MQNLYFKIQKYMTSDDESPSKTSMRLTRRYMSLNDEQKKLIDSMFIALMGYGLGTLIKEVDKEAKELVKKPESITIDVVGYHPNDENGEVDESQMVYDFEEMANAFEDKLSELDDTAVVMCSVHTKDEEGFEEENTTSKCKRCGNGDIKCICDMD